MIVSFHDYAINFVICSLLFGKLTRIKNNYKNEVSSLIVAVISELQRKFTNNSLTTKLIFSQIIHIIITSTDFLWTTCQ